MEDFANEILLHIFSFFSLESPKLVEPQLILLSNIIRVRRALFDFSLVHQYFHKNAPWVLANLKLFAGQKYIDDLMDQYPYVPERPFASGFRNGLQNVALWEIRCRQCTPK